MAWTAPSRSAEDALPDLVLRAGWEVCTYFNQGDRIFRISFEGCFPGAMAFGDINGDGLADKVTELGVFLGHGDGIFGICTVAFVRQDSAMALVCGDLNRDGYSDVVMGTRGIRTFLGNPDGTLTPFQTEGLQPYEAGGVPPILRLVDLDGDGNEDIVGGSAGGPVVAFGKGDGTFVRGAEPHSHGFPYPQRAKYADFNEDGILDIVTSGGGHEPPDRFYAAVYVVLGLGKATLAAPVEMRIAGSLGERSFIPGVAAGDVDRDGHQDIVAAGGLDGRLAVFFGRGDGTFEEEESERLPVEDLALALGLEDLDLDGCLDLVVCYYQDRTQVYWGLDGGGFNYAEPTHIRARNLSTIEPVRNLHRKFIRGDADIDGRVDLSDAIRILDQLFAGKAMVCGDASDADDDGLVALTDGIYLVQHLFTGGSPPPHPYPEPGVDPTADRGDYIQGKGDDLGCSFETFNYLIDGHEPCVPDEGSIDYCKPPFFRVPLQLLDVSVGN
jgi:hypothetical protein